MSEIFGFTFGGESSRFLCFRKHVNSMNDVQLKKLPFFCWECLTIFFKQTTLDIVIKDQNSMDTLLKYLIHEINTVDGTRDSATDVKEECYKIKLKKFKDRNSKNRKVEVRKLVEKIVINRTMFAYRLMRIRMKISFYCLLKRKTVSELVMTTILNTHSFFCPNAQDCYEFIQKEVKIHEFSSTKDSLTLVMKLSHFLTGLKYNPEKDWKMHLGC